MLFIQLNFYKKDPLTFQKTKGISIATHLKFSLKFKINALQA